MKERLFQRDRYVGPLLVLLAADMLIFWAAIPLAYHLRFHSLALVLIPYGHGTARPMFGEYIHLANHACLLGLLVFSLFGFYRRRYGLNRHVEPMSIILACLVTYVFLMAWLFVYFHSRFAYSRPIVMIALGVTAWTTIAVHGLLKKMQGFLMDRGIGFLRTLLIAREEDAPVLLERIREHHGSLHHILGYMGMEGKEPREIGGVPFLGTVNLLADVLEGISVDRVILALPSGYEEKALSAIRECRNKGVEIRLVPALFDVLACRTPVKEMGGVSTLPLGETPLIGVRLWVKSSMDMIIAGILLVVLAVPMLGIAILIRLTGRGPVLFRQERIGFDGRAFTMYKFRTMVVDAEKTTGPVFAVPDDPRCTRLGKILRNLNLDELPQLFNVVRGEMSLVGPRPERPHFVDRFKQEIPRYMTRHMVKSGMTGLAQIRGLRGNTPIRERIQCDLYYIENWSLLMDLKILLRTLFATRNAY